MGSIGDCDDNSLVESFWGTMQLEFLDSKIWRTRTEFFFSSRRRHTRLTCDWSSDVCSSDLGSGVEDERAHRALARVQTLLGHGSVLAPVLDGGRDPAQRTRLVPWGDEPVAVRSPEQPWPGALPAPAPSVLLDPPRAARVLDAGGRPVVVTERGAMPAPPALFAIGSEKPVAITSWAGPWPVDERWWSPSAARHVVRCQVVDVRG